MYNKFDTVGTANIGAGGQDSSLSYDFEGSQNARFGILLVYQAVSLVTGCSLQLVPGMGNGKLSSPIGPLPSPAPWQRFATPDPNTTFSPPLAAPVLINDVNDPLNGMYVSFTVVTVTAQEVSRFMNLQFQNLDAANGPQVSVFVDS